jgi:hypothetical protein
MRPFRISEDKIVEIMEKHDCTEEEAEDILMDGYEDYAEMKFE